MNRFKDPFLPSIVMNGAELPENKHFRVLGLTFSNDLTWNNYIESIAKSAPMKIGSLYRARNFLSPESILYLYKATIRPCLEYCCHIWSGASADCLSLLDRLQRRIVNIVGPDLCSNLQSYLFYKYFHGCCSDELKSLTPALKSFKRVTRFSTSAHPFTVQLPSCNSTLLFNKFLSSHFWLVEFFTILLLSTILWPSNLQV